MHNSVHVGWILGIDKGTLVGPVEYDDTYFVDRMEEDTVYLKLDRESAKALLVIPMQWWKKEAL